MNENEFRSIMFSDQKLWDFAETTDETPNSLTKSINVPWGIGTIDVTLEGTNNASGRRAAFEGFGNYIRDLIKERTSDESVTARAKQSDVRDAELSLEQPNPLQIPDTFASTNIAEASSPTAIANRADLVENKITRLVQTLEELRLELKGLNAFLEVYDASAHKKTPQPDKATASKDGA